MSNLVDYAKDELTRAKLFDKDSDYNGMIAEAVMELITVLSKQGHSGGSIAITMQVFNRVADFKPLTPLSTDPNEWNEIDKEMTAGNSSQWQSRRRPDVFSTDGGKTAYRWCDCENRAICMKCNSNGHVIQELKTHE